MGTGSRLKRLLGRCWRCFAWAAIAAAVLLTLLRLALPWLSGYRDELAAAVADYIEAPVRIEGLSVAWRGLGPQLELKGVRVGAPRGEGLDFERAAIDLALAWPSGSRLPLRVEGVELAGLALRARRDAEGRFHWREHTVILDDERDLDWLFSVDELGLRDVRITLDTPAGTRVLTLAQLRLVNDGTRHRLAVRARGPGGDSGRARITAELAEPAGEEGALSWRVYVDADALALPTWSALVPPMAFEAAAGRVDGRVWLRGAGERLERAHVDGRVAGLDVRSRATDVHFRARRFEGRWLWQRRGAGWRLAGEGVRLERDGTAWPETQVTVARSQGANGDPDWHARAGFADIADVAAAARLMELPEAVSERLDARRPRGHARRVAWDWSGPDDWSATARFDGLGWAAGDRVPGVTGIDGRLRAGPERARLAVRTEAARVRLPQRLRGPIPIAHAAGTVEVERRGGAWRVHSERFELANADVAATARWALRFGGDRPPWIDLQADFGQGDLSALSRYLPARTMDPEALEWLDRALERGRVTNGTALWRGALSDFPYREAPGHFSVRFDATGARIAFDPEWPVLTSLNGHVRIDGPALTARAEQGRFLDGHIGDLRVRFDDLARPFMDVDAAGGLPMADVIHLATATPLRAALGEAFRGAVGAGRVAAELELAVPLDNTDAAAVDGRLRLDGAAFSQPRFGLDLTDIRGLVAFDETSVTIDDMRARHADQPVSIQARPSDATRAAVRFVVTGTLTPRELLPRGARAIARCCAGRSQWRVTAEVPTGDDSDQRPVIVTASSDLAGTALDMPAPFAKAAPPARRLDVRTRFSSDGKRGRTWFSYSGTIRGVLELVEDEGGARVERGTIRFGGGDPALAEQSGLRLTGRIERLPVDAWLDWLQSSREGARRSGGVAVTHADLAIGRALYGPLEAAAVDARVRRQRQRLVIDLNSSALMGRIEVPATRGGDRTVRARFERVDWALLQPRDGGERRDAGNDAASGDWPPLDWRIDRLKLRHGTLHDAALVTQPTAAGYRIHRLGFDSPGLSLRGEGDWRSGDPPRTRLNVSLDGDDYGRGLAAFGYGSFLEGGSGAIRARLSWPGAPWAPSVAGLEGHAELDLEQGRLAQLDVGPARILGLFSLDLPGFLRSGFSFDSISGRVELADGNAFMRGVSIEGGPGLIRIRGRTGLVARDYDQRVLFRPELSGSLTALGVLSGGPVTGVGVLVVQGLLNVLGVDVEEVSELEYRLTGSWADPNVQLVTAEPSRDESDESQPRRRGQ